MEYMNLYSYKEKSERNSIPNLLSLYVAGLYVSLSTKLGPIIYN